MIARLSVALSALSAWIAVASGAPGGVKPNFVIIMADDLGYGDLGCYGSRSIPTPNIDALAAAGMRFTDFHSNGAVCSPTRAALLTGRYQQRCGIGGVVTAARHRHTGLDLEETTFAEALKTGGYATAIFGKWHVGYAPEFNPVHQGFDRFRGYVSGNVDFFSHIDQAGYEDWWEGAELAPEEGYTTHLITRHGVDFIREHRGQPFCLYLAHEAPHYPYQGPGDKALRVKGDPGKIAGAREDVGNAYREMVVEMDKGVGEIVAALRDHGLEGETLVMFFSDNGANSKGSNGALRGHKGQLWEGGHRVPCVAAWPGVIEPGTESRVTAMTMDVFPTLLECAGIGAPAALDGVSLLPVLKGGELAPRSVFWQTGRAAAVRRGKWKLVLGGRGGGGGAELYDLGADLGERDPVDDAAKRAELGAELEKWRATWEGVEPRS